VVADLTEPELPSAGANPTVTEVLTGAGHVVKHINTAIDTVPILLSTANIFPNATTLGMRTGLQKLLLIINNKICFKDYSSIKKNTVFIKRKNYLFNPLSNVMTDSQAGSFSFRIPLEHLFNFCENYTKVIFNCKHELQLNRQTADYALFKSVFLATKGKVQLSLMQWYLPEITPNEQYEAELYQHICTGA